METASLDGSYVSAYKAPRQQGGNSWTLLRVKGVDQT